MAMELSQRQIINRVYQDICGFEISKTDAAKVKSSHGSPVYGEITVTSTNKLFSHLKIGKNDVLYDLGSGVGKVIIFAGLFTPVKKAIGVELSKMRHRDSLCALERAKAYDKKLPARCHFENTNFLKMDLSKASIIYSCSTAFSIAFMRTLTARLAQFTHDFRFVTLQDLPDETHFELEDIIRLDMSWQRATPVHIYRRSRSE
jgi:hypothetical protein